VQKPTFKREVIEIPQTLEQATKVVRQIGEKKREIDEIQLVFNNQVEQLKAQATGQSLPHEQELSRLVEVLYAFAASHRDELTDRGKKKTVELPTGWFRWRLKPASVVLTKAEKLVIAALKQMGLERFVRTKEEVDKQAILREQEVAIGVAGFKIKQDEFFEVRPADLRVTISKNTDKLKKRQAANN